MSSAEKDAAMRPWPDGSGMRHTSLYAHSTLLAISSEVFWSPSPPSAQRKRQGSGEGGEMGAEKLLRRPEPQNQEHALALTSYRYDRCSNSTQAIGTNPGHIR